MQCVDVRHSMSITPCQYNYCYTASLSYASQVLSQLRALKFAGLKQPPESDQLEMLGSRLPGLQYLMLTNCVIVQEQTPQETQHSKTMARRGVADGGLRDGGFGGLPHTSDACKVRAFPSQSAWTSFWCIQIPAAVEFEWQ